MKFHTYIFMVLVLGGGLAGLSFSYFYPHDATVLEKDTRMGGLCRSYKLNHISYDIGPHILFSKNKEILDFHTSMIETTQLRRSNQIFFKKRFVKYPFENGLSALSSEDREYCLQEFLKNPYASYTPKTMQQFFLTTFGEGITKLYLQPYNEKIWKYDPAYLDLQMVERIPKPPPEEIVRSAQGTDSEGYLHQLYFHYPKSGGIETLIEAYLREVEKKGKKHHTDTRMHRIYRNNNMWRVETNHGSFESPFLVNCMPLFELAKYLELPSDVGHALNNLKYNSIYIVVLQVRKDFIGDHFAMYIPDADIVFHRLSKLNFLGEAYCLPDGGVTLMAEITFRPDSYLSGLSEEVIQSRVISDLERLGFVHASDVFDVVVRRFEYAYVIYDTDHRKNTDCVLHYLKSIGIYCCGRFAEMEYLNTDAVAERAKRLAMELSQIKTSYDFKDCVA